MSSTNQSTNQSTDETLILDICRPSDWHHHFREAPREGPGQDTREGPITREGPGQDTREGPDWLQTTVPACFSQFHYAVAMPNLANPVRTYQQALEYHHAIHTAMPPQTTSSCRLPQSEACMTYYLSPDLALSDIQAAADDPYRRIIGAKYYPQGATTNSSFGVSDYRQVRQQLQKMSDTWRTLMIHGEDPTHPDIFAREKAFLTDPDNGQLRPILEEFGALQITLEHISSAAAAQCLSDEWAISKSARLAATITPHHLKYTVSDIFGAGCCGGHGIGIKPHLFCCPVLKSFDDLDALQELAVGGHSNIFLGTDCAPHTDAVKQTLGRPGVFNIHSALSDITEVFVGANKLAQMEGFVSLNGCHWYRKPAPTQLRTRIYSVSAPEDRPIVPKVVYVGNNPSMRVTPMRCGERLPYRVESGL